MVSIVSAPITVAEVSKEVRAYCADLSTDQLRDEVESMGYDSRFTRDMTRAQLIAKLVDLEVYAFTH